MAVLFYIEDARTIPSIAMTANAFEEDRKRAIDIEKMEDGILSVLKKQKNL